MDDYGKSMIAISVNDDGSLNTCTCRWNHDNNANDSMMDTKEISEFFGVNFYETFKPYEPEDIWKKLVDKAEKPDDFCKFFDCIKICEYREEYDDYEEYIYIKMIDGKIVQLPRIDDKTTYLNDKFVTIKNGKFVEARPTKITQDVFINCAFLKSITIPNSVTEIGQYAFDTCTSLKSITIPNSVTKIGQYAFSYCYSLESITIPNSVTEICNWVFYACESLKSITIPNSVTKIGDGAFSECYSLESITIPDNVTEIGEYAFDTCTSLKSITIPDSVTEIGKRAFYKSTALESVIFSSNSPLIEKIKKEYINWGIDKLDKIKIRIINN